ncbi:MAG: zinc-binding dehydrogenase, partial [Phycisphaeraceae bacterium]
YRSHYLCAADDTVVAPDAIPDDQLGAIWLAYLTAWGCLAWKQQLQRGQIVAMPAASSSVALAAAQIVKKLGGISIGLTTRASKLDTLRQMSECVYDHLLLTRDPSGDPTAWYKDIKRITDGRGVDVFFDPVAAGQYLETEIRSLAQGGVVWVYGLLGEPGAVNVTPLIRKAGTIRGWAVAHLAAEPDALETGYRFILDGFASGGFRQHVDRVFKLDDVREAHTFMEQGRHIGKLVLVP